MSSIRLVIADVDGTLLTPGKVLTEGAMNAVRRLREAGIAFAITSGRPPRGLRMLIGPLGLTTPIAAALGRHGLDVWVYRGADWFVHRLHAPHVEREQQTVGFAPTLAAAFDGLHGRVVKIVGVGDDLPLVARAESEVREQFGDHVSAARSQPYYLDLTHPNANKGEVVKRLAGLLSIPTASIAALGDMPNDILMFALSGLSIAMGNASREVQRAARRVTSSNEDEGFARAIERYVLI